MRVLHLIHSEGTYGAERILVYLGWELRRAGHEIIIGSIRDPGTPPTDFELFAASWGLQVHPIRIAPRPTPGVIRELLGVIRRLEPDIVHSHGYKANILLGLLPRRWRAPMLSTVHGWTFPRPLTSLWVYEQLDRLCLRGMESVVVVGRRMLELPGVRAAYGRRLKLIENGIPPLEARMADQQRAAPTPLPEGLLAFVSAKPTLVTIGRLSQEKGFHILLEAFARLRQQDPRYQLAILGEGPERAALLGQVSRLGISDCIRLAGYVEYADRALEGAAGFVMSSLTEGMPLVLLEAMQRRVPIVATRVGAIPEVLEHGRGGVLVEPNSVDSLAEGIGSLLTGDGKGAQRAEAAYEAVSTRYSSARMAEEYSNEYEHVIQRTRRRSA